MGNFLLALRIIPADMSYWQFALSQVFALITFACVFINFIVNGKKNILFWHVIGSVFWLLMFALLDNLVGMVLAGIGIVRSGMFLICELKTGKGWKIGGKVTLYFMITLGFVLFALGFWGVLGVGESNAFWWDWIVIATSVLFVVGTYMKSKHIVRIGTVLYAASLIIQFVIRAIPEPFGGSFTPEAFNIGGIAIEVSKIISVVVFYVLLVVKKDNAKQKKTVFAFPFKSEGCVEVCDDGDCEDCVDKAAVTDSEVVKEVGEVLIEEEAAVPR